MKCTDGKRRTPSGRGWRKSVRNNFSRKTCRIQSVLAEEHDKREGTGNSQRKRTSGRKRLGKIDILNSNYPRDRPGPFKQGRGVALGKKVKITFNNNNRRERAVCEEKRHQEGIGELGQAGEMPMKKRLNL